MRRKEGFVPDEKLTHWVGVIAKSLAFLSTHVGQEAKKNMVEKALFLEAVGLTSDEQAGLLGSTPESLKQQKYLARKNRGDKGGNGGSKKKPTKKGRAGSGSRGKRTSK
jgi:hypothetical protein